MSTTYAYAATDSRSPLAPFEFQRRALRDLDVQIDVLYCGVCHSDLHRPATNGATRSIRSCRAMKSSAA